MDTSTSGSDRVVISPIQELTRRRLGDPGIAAPSCPRSHLGQSGGLGIDGAVDQRIRHSGARFSANARAPSTESSDVQTDSISDAPMRRA